MSKRMFDFLTACQIVGGVCGSNGRYQRMLWERVEKTWQTMTVAQLIDAIELASAEFNEHCKRMEVIDGQGC